MDASAIAEFERRSLESLLKKSKGTSYEATLKRIVALRLRGSGSGLSQEEGTNEHFRQHRPYSPPETVEREPERERDPRDRAGPRSVMATPDGVRRRRSLSQTSSRSGSVNGSERTRGQSANRYWRSASKERNGPRSFTYDDRWRGRSNTPPPRPFTPTLLAKTSNDRILATTRASETFDERMDRSVNNYYIRQAFSCFKNDGPGQYTKTVTVPYHQRFAPSNVRTSAVGTFGTEQYNDSFMSKTFARSPMKRDSRLLEPAVGQYSPPNTHSRQFHSRIYEPERWDDSFTSGANVNRSSSSSRYAHSREERWENAHEPEVGQTPSSMASSSRTRMGQGRGDVHEQGSGRWQGQGHGQDYQHGMSNREQERGRNRSMSTPGSRKSSTPRMPSTAVDQTPTEQRLRHLLKLIAVHNNTNRR